MIKFTYLKQPPRKYTFEMPKVKKWVESKCKGKVLNLFAGKTLLHVPEIRVDIDSEMPAYYHMDAYDYVEQSIEMKMKFDTVILDPPYSLRKSMEKYNGKIVSKHVKILNILPKIIKYNGIVVSFGYRSIVMGKSRGFIQKEICLISHSGAFHDTIAVIEEKNV